MIKHFKFIILLLFFYASSLNAKTYYVATNGSSSNNGTSISSPFKDVDQAILLSLAGDTIYIRSGVYSHQSRINVSKSGTSNKPIFIFAYPPDIQQAWPADGRPVFDFSGMSVASGNQGFLLSGANCLHIKGIKIKGAGDNGMLLRNSSNNIIEFCDFFKNRDSGLQLMDGSSDNYILNCDSYMNADLGEGTNSNGGNADGFAPKLTVGSGNIFKGCRAWLNSDDGWDGYLKTEGTAYPDGMTTTLENCWTWSNGFYWLDGSTNSEMNGNGFKMGGSTNKNLAHNFILKRCLSFYNKAKGFDQNSTAGSISLYNCSSHENGTWEYMLNSSGVSYVPGSIFIVKNSIALSTKSNTFRTGTVLETNNFQTSPDDFTSMDTLGISEKRSIDGNLPEIEFFHLQTNPQSELIDAGTLVDGIQFTGSKPDLGCFEVGLLSGNWLKIQEVNSFSVFPNPAREYVRVSEINKATLIQIFSTDGKNLREVVIDSGDEKIDLSGLNRGIYLLKIENKMFKLIKW